MKHYVANVLRALLNRPTRVVERREKHIPIYLPVLQSELLRGRKALITGATSGIGYCLAEAFLKAGGLIIAAGRNAEKLDKSVCKLRQFGCVEPCLFDVENTETFMDVVNGLGRFDILVNNAGYVGGGVFGSTEREEYDKVLETNLRGAYFLSQAVSKKWIADGVKGNILNICSASSLRPGNTPYILSKWGLRSLTVGMARELIKHGIVVNGIAPGCTNTPLFCDESREDITNMPNPSHRFVTMQEVSNLAVVLVSDLSKMVVGDILYVTGGAAITTYDD